MDTNEERIKHVRDQLVVIEKLEYAYRKGELTVVGEAVEISPQVKANLKQKLVAARVDCITTLNLIQI